MTYKEIVSILLSEYVGVEDCSIQHIKETDNLKEKYSQFSEVESLPTGDYFLFYVWEKDYDYVLERCLADTNDKEPSCKIYNDGHWMVFFKID